MANNRFVFPLVCLTLLVGWDVLVYLLMPFIESSLVLSAIALLGGLLCVFLLIQSVAYRLIKRNRFVLVFFLLISTVVSFGVSEVLYKINQHYAFDVAGKSYTISNIWQIDNVLGHAAVPNSKGAFKYTLNATDAEGQVGVSIDAFGARSSTCLHTASEVIALLGCSFTFGDFVHDTATYASIIGKRSNMCPQNWGGSGYGLAQMQIRFDSLVVRPEVRTIVVQYSPWLAKRSAKISRDAHFGSRAYPYYDQLPALTPPIFSTSTQPFRDWRHSRKSWWNKHRFAVEKGWTTNVVDRGRYIWASVKVALGFAPKPIKDLHQLEEYVYRYFARRTKEHGKHLVVLKIKYPEELLPEWFLEFRQDLNVVDVDAVFREHYGDDTDSPYRIYHEYEDGSRELINRHPSAHSHSLIGEALLVELEKEE